MSRAYLVYIFMFVVAIAGLWVILTVGAAVKAPDDLSGEWNITWAEQPPPRFNSATMTISQSGRYFLVGFGTEQALSLTLRPLWHGARDGRTLRMELDGENWKLHLSGPIPLAESPRVGELTIVLSGDGTHVGFARRADFQPTTRQAGVAHAR